MPETEKFAFGVIDKKLAFTQNKDVQSLFEKWDLKLDIQYFNFDKVAQDVDLPTLLKNMFEDESVLKKLGLNPYVNKCEVEQLSTTIMNMAFLDRYKQQDLEPLICRESGTLVGCSPDLKEGIQVDDELRCALADQSSVHYYLYNEDEQSEFLFRLFKLLVLGGPVCQYENDINVYLDTAKSLYKDLLSIKQNVNGQKVIRSRVFEIELSKGDQNYAPGGPVASYHTQNKCFVIIDPFYRHITTLTHRWDSKRQF